MSDKTIKASIPLGAGINKNHDKVMVRMLTDMLFRQAYQEKVIPTFLSFDRKKDTYSGELEGFVEDGIDFNSYIEAEIIHMWEERFTDLWAENKDTHQA